MPGPIIRNAKVGSSSLPGSTKFSNMLSEFADWAGRYCSPTSGLGDGSLGGAPTTPAACLAPLRGSRTGEVPGIAPKIKKKLIDRGNNNHKILLRMLRIREHPSLAHEIW